jgi:hypothetical protein
VGTSSDPTIAKRISGPEAFIQRTCGHGNRTDSPPTLLAGGLRLTCRPPWTTLHRPAARCEAATPAQRTDPAAGHGDRQTKAAGGQVQPIVRQGMAKMPNRLPPCSAKPRPQTLPYQPAPAAPTRTATNAAGPTPDSDRGRRPYAGGSPTRDGRRRLARSDTPRCTRARPKRLFSSPLKPHHTILVPR